MPLNLPPKSFSIVVMGSSCSCSESGCCKDSSYQRIPVVENPHWSNAVREGNINAIKFLHSDDPGLIDSIVNDAGERAIHVAARLRKVEILEYLLENGAEKDMKSVKTGNTALHEAALQNDIPCIKTLIGHGAKITIKNRKKQLASDLCTVNSN